LPPTHPLARRKSVTFTATLAFDQIEIQPGSMVQITLRRAAAMAGQTIRHRIQVSTIDAACRPEKQSKPRAPIRLVDRKPEGNA